MKCIEVDFDCSASSIAKCLTTLNCIGPLAHYIDDPHTPSPPHTQTSFYNDYIALPVQDHYASHVQLLTVCFYLELDRGTGQVYDTVGRGVMGVYR